MPACSFNRVSGVLCTPSTVRAEPSACWQNSQDICDSRICWDRWSKARCPLAFFFFLWELLVLESSLDSGSRAWPWWQFLLEYLVFRHLRDLRGRALHLLASLLAPPGLWISQWCQRSASTRYPSRWFPVRRECSPRRKL